MATPRCNWVFRIGLFLLWLLVASAGVCFAVSAILSDHSALTFLCLAAIAAVCFVASHKVWKLEMFWWGCRDTF